MAAVEAALIRVSGVCTKKCVRPSLYLSVLLEKAAEFLHILKSSNGQSFLP